MKNPKKSSDLGSTTDSKSSLESSTDSENSHEPVDPNYVLTFDNVIKILAIVLRFRYVDCLKFAEL